VGIFNATRPRVHGHEQARRLASVCRTLFSHLVELDRSLIDIAPAFEHPALTGLFVLLSAWWVKGPLLVGLGLCCDVWRRRLPLAFLAAAAATLTASLLVGTLKDLFERERPPEVDPGLGSLVAIPDNPSFPSGHAATAFAAATAIAILSPRMRPYALGLAAAVALSRVYLRVHFPLDVLAGSLLGACLGAIAAWAAIRIARPAEPRPA
jgi:undecaprenyl-diphosphatase